MPEGIGTRAEVAVVGAGVTGLSTAFHLAERGVRGVVVLDREGIGAGASGVQPGGVRQQWATRVNCLLARASLAFYRELGERLAPRIDPGFRACGYLFAAQSEATLAGLARAVRLQRSLGVPSRLLRPEEAAEVVPGLDTATLVGASYCGEDGYFDRPQAVVEAFAAAAQRLGAGVERADVRALEPRPGGWRLRLDGGRSLDAATVVLAAGVDTVPLASSAGAALPIEAERRWLFLGAPVRERLLDPLVVAPDRAFAAKQLADGRVLASDLDAAGDPATGRARWRRRVRDAIAELLPRLELVAFPELVGGVYDVTPDRQAIVGRLPGRDGLIVAAGFSGHGFMIAPEVGRAVAALAVGEDPGPLVAELAPDRFERGALVPEPQVV